MTPGASRARRVKLRPFSGRSVTYSPWMTSPIVAFEVFTRGAALVTSTVVPTTASPRPVKQLCLGDSPLCTSRGSMLRPERTRRRSHRIFVPEPKTFSESRNTRPVGG